jgi:hydroxylamine reductase (hybrid-cluster protein)
MCCPTLLDKPRLILDAQPLGGLVKVAAVHPELPLSFEIAWYEQKAVALLFLGVKGMGLGPTLPGFLSPNVAKVLAEKFDIKPIGTVQEDIAAMMAGK